MDAYRTPTEPTPQRKPRMEWRLDIAQVSMSEPHVEIIADAVAGGAIVATIFATDGLNPVVSAALATLVATLVWCACFVRRREVTP